MCGVRLSEAGFAVEHREYLPHCTLGRPRQRWQEAASSAWLRCAQKPPLAVFTARSVVLYESITRPDGALHMPRTVLSLAASRAESVS